MKRLKRLRNPIESWFRNIKINKYLLIRQSIIILIVFLEIDLETMVVKWNRVINLIKKEWMIVIRFIILIWILSLFNKNNSY